MYFKGFSTAQQLEIVSFLNSHTFMINGSYYNSNNYWIRPFRDENGKIYWMDKNMNVDTVISEIKKTSGYASYDTLTFDYEINNLEKFTGSLKVKAKASIQTDPQPIKSVPRIAVYLEVANDGNLFHKETYAENIKVAGLREYNFLQEDFKYNLFRHRLYIYGFDTDQTWLTLNLINSFTESEYSLENEDSIGTDEVKYFSHRDAILTNKFDPSIPIKTEDFFDEDEIDDPDLLETLKDAYRDKRREGRS